MLKATFALVSLLLFASPVLARADVGEASAAASVSTGNASDAGEPVSERSYTLHLQSTLVPQRHDAMTSPYQGNASLVGNAEQNMSYSGTVFLGYRPLKGTEVFFNPEFIAGGGLSNAYGLGAYPNGEINRVGNAGFQANVARLYVAQTIALGEETEAVADDQNTISGTKAAKYLRFTAGKYSLADFLDGNAYGHDQRTQYLNWCFMDNCAWDFSMNPFGYTYAFLTELKLKDWAVRLLVATEPTQVNGSIMDMSLLNAHATNLELERGYSIRNHPGKVRLLVYENSSLAPKYTDATAVLVDGSAASSVAAVPGEGPYHTKYGCGINIEQEINEDIGVFARAGMNDGQTESWTFTETDMTLAGGLSLSGRLWRRPSDTLGFGLGVGGLSPEHANFLAAGGQGLMLGDGALTYGPEQYAEIYYSFEVPRIRHLAISPDLQYIQNPGFNQDRGPVAVYAVRVHYEWGM